MHLKVNYDFGSRIGIKSADAFPTCGKISKESGFDSKFYSGHLKEMSVLFKERFAHMRKSEVPMIFHVSPINTLDVSVVVKL
jgi:hypothetical protein